MRLFKYILASTVALTNAADITDYATNGANWPKKYPDCAGGTQSPIDLKTDAPKVDSTGDFFKFYSNLYNRKVTWLLKTSTNYVDVNPAGVISQVTTDQKLNGYFTSQYGQRV